MLSEDKKKVQGQCHWQLCVMSELRRRHMNSNKAFQSLMEFGAMIRYHATDEEDKWKLASKLCEGLTGESLKVAMALGVDKLSQKGGVLNRSWWKPFGPTCSQCLLLMPSLPSEDGGSRQKPLESSPFQGGSHKFKPRVSCMRKLCKTNHFFVGYLLGRSRRCCSFSGSWR